MSTQNENYLITLASFEEADPDRIATPLVLANSALANDKNVLLWLVTEGVQLAKKGAVKALTPKSFAPVSELLDTFIENGGKIGICPPCASTHGLTDENIVDNAQLLGAVALLEQTAGHQTFSF